MLWGNPKQKLYVVYQFESLNIQFLLISQAVKCMFSEIVSEVSVWEILKIPKELFGKVELSPILDLPNTISLVIVQNPCQVKFSH